MADWRGWVREAAARVRAWMLGPGVVEAFEPTYGHDGSTFSPAEYGDYLATSNAVYACATLRADMLASIPLRCFATGNGKKLEVTEGPVVELMGRVNPFWTMNRLIEMTELSLCLWGQCFWAVERGETGRGEPREIWWMRPDRVTIYPDPVNYVRGFEYSPTGGQKPIWFEPWEVIWFRFPNPLDEFAGLSPMAAARLAADLGSAAAKSNKRLFDQGYMMGGVVTPPKGTTLTPEQAKELEKSLDARFKGVDKAHRWGVLRFEAEMRSMGISPKDAEFLGALNWSLEEVARAYKVPLDMVGGQRTYENVQAAERAFWFRTMEPESRFVASEIVEQLLPMFGPKNRVTLVVFDLRKVPILQEAEGARWSREKEQIQVGAITVNEWRLGQGLEAVEWGDVWWGPATVVPISSEELPVTSDQSPVTSDQSPVTSAAEDGGQSPVAPKTADSGEEGGGNQGQGAPRLLAGTPALAALPAGRGKGARGGVEYGSEEHERAWRKFEKRVGKWEKKVGKTAADLFERQRVSVVDRLKAAAEEEGRQTPIPSPSGVAKTPQGKGARGVQDAADEPFDLGEWIKKFRIELRLVLRELVEEVGQAEMEGLGLDVAFDVDVPAVRRFLERRAQRFAKEVNETTWEQLKASLSEGIDAGEGLPKLMERVNEVMDGRIASSAEVIARTEVIGASNGGSLEAWRQSGVVGRKTWLSALLPDRTRESHIEAHQRYQADPIGLDEDFEVGAGAGPFPGGIGLPEEDCNCFCTMQPVVE